MIKPEWVQQKLHFRYTWNTWKFLSWKFLSLPIANQNSFAQSIAIKNFKKQLRGLSYWKMLLKGFISVNSCTKNIFHKYSVLQQYKYLNETVNL